MGGKHPQSSAFRRGLGLSSEISGALMEYRSFGTAAGDGLHKYDVQKNFFSQQCSTYFSFATTVRASVSADPIAPSK